jgi:hypothetical protein
VPRCTPALRPPGVLNAGLAELVGDEFGQLVLEALRRRFENGGLLGSAQTRRTLRSAERSASAQATGGNSSNEDE